MYRLFSLVFVAILFLNSNSCLAREVLYATSLSEKLQAIVTHLQNPQQAKVPYAELVPATEYFIRIIPRKYVMTETNTLQEGATLGGKPFVFFTTPEGAYGKSLLELYLDIGYEAEDILLWQRNQEMVAVVFHYPATVTFFAPQNGELPTDWDKKVYVPTWDNIFALFRKLTENATIEPTKQGDFAPQRLFFKTELLKNFVLAFPEEGKQRLKTTDYAVLKAAGGADWLYRQLLENKLSIFEHFRGTGRTLNELKGEEQGLLEFVGPNLRIKDMTEFAVVGLGALTMEEAYTSTPQGKP